MIFFLWSDNSRRIQSKFENTIFYVNFQKQWVSHPVSVLPVNTWRTVGRTDGLIRTTRRLILEQGLVFYLYTVNRNVSWSWQVWVGNSIKYILYIHFKISLFILFLLSASLFYIILLLATTLCRFFVSSIFSFPKLYLVVFLIFTYECPTLDNQAN